MNTDNITMTQEQMNALIQSAVHTAMASLPTMSVPQMKGDTITLQEYATTWFEAKRHDIQQTTFSKYCNLYRTHIQPALGSMVLSAITRGHIQSFINDLVEHPYKQETIKAIKALLSSMLKLASADDYIHKNPCDAVKMPKRTKKKKRPATQSEYLRLLKVSKDHRLWIAIPLLFLTGCRRGEVLALTWEDIDFQNRCIHITKEYTVENGSGRAFLRDTTKTPAGIRDIPMCTDLCRALKHYREHEGRGKTYVLSQVRDDKMTHPQVFYKIFKNWLYDADISDDITPHSARHYFAVSMLKAGVNPENLRKIMGHSDLSTTLDVYCYDNELNDKDTKEVLNAMRDLSPAC